MVAEKVWFNSAAVHVHVQVLKQLARTYADAHETMSNNDTDRCGASFYRTRGIINGALWYSFAGGEIQHFSIYRENHSYSILPTPHIACEGLVIYMSPL